MTPTTPAYNEATRRDSIAKCQDLLAVISSNHDFDRLDLESLAVGYLIGIGYTPEQAHDMGISAACEYFR